MRVVAESINIKHGSPIKTFGDDATKRVRFGVFGAGVFYGYREIRFLFRCHSEAATPLKNLDL